MHIRSALSLVTVCAAFAASAVNERTAFVNPFIGTEGTGHCFPGACRPFGLVQASPDTGNQDWAHCSGYVGTDVAIKGFSQTHLNGTGVPDLGDVLIRPYIGRDTGAMEYLKESEAAEPGYYAVVFTNGIRTEITTSARTAFYRFTFPQGEAGRLVIDANHGLVSSDFPDLSKCRSSTFDEKTMTGSFTSDVWVRGRKGYFAVATNRLDNVLLVKIALSTRSVEGAARNLAEEIPHWDFDRVRAEARAEWEGYLARLSVPQDECGAVKTNLYTSLYHLFIQPNVISDVGEDEEYSTFSTWDTFRAANALYAMLVPEKEQAFVDSMMRFYRRKGVLPRWGLWGGETWCMIGHHGVPIVAEAFFKGFAMDAEEAYRAVRDTLTKNEPADEMLNPHFEYYEKYGYLPSDFLKGESVSRQMEDCYDFSCAARMAKALGKDEDAARFTRLADSWTNIFDKATGFVRPRRSDGSWRKDFNPMACGLNTWATPESDYTEGNAWQWSFHVLHDPETLIEMHGGTNAFIAKLDTFFTLKSDAADAPADVTGLIGQYAHGNEPSHHAAFLYALAGRPERTAELVREICETQYAPRPDGLCGNDDCGQMSAWYLFAHLGKYPVDPASGNFVEFKKKGNQSK